MHRRLRARFAVLGLVALLFAAGSPLARADEADPLPGIRKAQTKRLMDLAGQAKEGRLASVAVRLYEEAAALDPENEDAKTALGWKSVGGVWTPPDPRKVPWAGWADDGEAELARLAKKEVAVRAQYAKDLNDAATSLRAKKAAPEVVERLLWAVVASDPAEVIARRALGHLEAGPGRYLAPEDAAVLEAAAQDAKADDALRTATSDLAEAEPLPQKLPGWPQGVPKGFRAPTAGPAVHSLADPSWARDGAAWLERTQRFLEALLPDLAAAKAFQPVTASYVHVPGRALAAALLRANGSAQPDAEALKKTSFVLGPYHAQVADTPAALFTGLAHLHAETVLTKVLGQGSGYDWLAEGLAVVATKRLLGTVAGRAAVTGPARGDEGPAVRPGERHEAFLRRNVALGRDEDLAAMVAKDVTEWRPRHFVKAWSLCDWLFHRDRKAASAFAAAWREPSADRLEAACKAAGFASAAALDLAWRRFVLDAYPVPDAAGAGGWKVTKLEKAKTYPAAESLYGPLAHPITGWLLMAGSRYLCEVADGGKSVKLHWLHSSTQVPRVVTEPGSYVMPIPREYGGGFFNMYLALLRSGSTWTVRSDDAWVGSVEGAHLAFLDVDLDGHANGFGLDGYVAGHGAWILPLRREIVLGSKVVEIRRLGPDGSALAWRSRPVAAKGADLEMLQRLNAWRTSSGIPALAWDADASVGALLHAEYLAENFPAGAPPEEARRQDATKKKATPAGALAASSSFVAAASPPAAAVDRLLGSIAARAALLDPDARRMAGASTRGVAVVSAEGADADEAESPFRGPLLFPPPDADGVPPRVTDRDAEAAGGAGFPVTLLFRGPEAGGDVELTLETAAGAVAEVVRVSPERLAAMGAGGVAAFVPKEALAPRAAYRVKASWGPSEKRVERAWTFKTGG